MKKSFAICMYCIVFFVFRPAIVYSQKNNFADSAKKYKAVEAGSQYRRSPFYQWLMGKNYRNEWTAPVEVPVLLLDTAKGGLTAYKAGGGHQTKSLHVKTAVGKEYALRSVDKTLGKVLPEILHHTFLEDLVNDEVSMSHPYAAASVPLMAQKAGIYHTLPQYVYLPKQPGLDTFNNKFGNALYLLEQRMSGSWQEAPNLGNFEKFLDTYDVIDSLHKNNRYKADQRLFVKCRLFDIFIGDWDRHEDQWQWGLADGKLYKPIPQDRDQAYFKYNGTLLKLLIAASGLTYFQAFDSTLPNVKTFNYEERNLDRFFTNEMTLRDWQSIAKELQQALTDEVITASLKQLPPEIFAIDGNEIIAKLQSRREHLLEYATTYYQFICKEVEVTGSKGEEAFEVNRTNDDETSVKIYRVKNGEKEQTPYYSRIFKTAETKELRLYGLSGNDTYTISGNVAKGIHIGLIGGDKRDTFTDLSVVQSGSGKTELYDDAGNAFTTSKKNRLHLSSDTGIHSYNYFNYLYDKKGVRPALFYNYEDRLFAGLEAQIIHHKWRQSPFAYRHRIAVNYSISQHAISTTYEGLFPKALGKWDVFIKANYDAIRWTKFFGLGNETQLLTSYNDFYRMRSVEWSASAGLNRKFHHHNISISGYFQSVKIINDAERFVSKIFTPFYPADLNTNRFAGAKLNYIFDKVNDSILPTRGFTFLGNATWSHNLLQSQKDFTKLYAGLQFYLPLSPKFSLSIQLAGLTVAGNPLFYQYVSVGGPETLRGYRLDRFWGKTAFYNANEIRYITNIKSYIFNGKAGLLALYDNGRVWMPGETSGAWHTAYGAGILLAPFNKILIVVTYATSPETKLFQLRVGRTF